MPRIPWLGLIFAVLCLPCAVCAAELEAEPSISLRGEYDDNVSFTRESEESDYAAIISPALTLDYRTELLDLHSRAALEILRFTEDKSLDTENHSYSMQGTYSPYRRFEFRADVLYRKDTTLESELEETGIVTSRQDRERYRGGLGMTYQLSERSDIGLDITHERTAYDGQSLDYKSSTVSFQYNRLLSMSGDVFTIQPYYTHYESDATEVDNYALSLGWAHNFTETLSLTAFAGVRYTEIEYTFVRERVVFDPDLLPYYPYRLKFEEVEVEDSNWNGVGDISLQKTGETYTLRGGYEHTLRYSSTGDPLTVYRLYMDYSKELRSRLDFRFSASAYSTESEGRFTQEDSKYLTFTPSLSYLLTQNHRLQVGYRYQYRKDQTAPDHQDYDRNRIWVSLILSFPEKWRFSEVL